MVDNVLLVIAVVAHIARLCQPSAAGIGAILNLIAGANGAACNGIAASVFSRHCLNHLITPSFLPQKSQRRCQNKTCTSRHSQQGKRNKRKNLIMLAPSK